MMNLTPFPTVPASLSSFSHLLDQHASTLQQQGRLDEALQAATTALTGLREAAAEDGGQTPRLCRGLQVLADIQRELGDAAGAEASYREALETALKAGLDTEEVAGLRTQLATLLDFSQREADAAPLYEQAISDYEGLTPPNEQIAGQLRNNLAMIYKGLGKYALAEQHYLRALESLESRQGKASEEVASVYNNLGSLYYTAGFPDQAKEMFLEALQIRRQLLGSDHRDVAQSHCNLATACHELGDNAASQENYEESLRILELHLREESVSYEAIALDYLALLGSLGEEKKAAALRKRLDKNLAELR